jgi:hypothetical protein
MPERERTVYTSVAVIGRIPYDDEDSCYIFNNVNVGDAIKLFHEKIYSETPDADPEEVKRLTDGKGIYVTNVLASHTQIVCA